MTREDDGQGDERPGFSPEEMRRRRARSIAIALALGFFVLLFYVVTIAKLGPQVLNRPL